ncbi:MAG: hypothetical protein WCC48_10965 [Anaeromyxobacteraceae bacterium]
MSKGLASGRVVRSRIEQPEHCLALSGKGTPDSAELREAMDAVTRAADALRSASLRGAHALEPQPVEVRLRAPSPGARGGSGWTVFVRVPAWVGEREALMAVSEASRHLPVARSIRLSPVVTEPTEGTSPQGRDKQPGQIRRRRVAPQHRARELL